MARASASMRSASARKNCSLTSALSRALRRIASFTASSLSSPRRLLAVAAVGEVGGAGALGRDHGRAQRALGRAGAPERRAIMRLLQAAEDLPADAGRRLQRLHGAYLESALGVELAELVPEPQAALGDGPDPSPLAIPDLEGRPHQPLGGRVARARHHP